MRYEKIKDILHPNDPSAAGFLSWYPDYYEIKQDIVKSCNPQIICEIGVRAGYSACAFMDACPDAFYFGFDADMGTHGGELGFTDWARKLLAGRPAKIWCPFDSQKVSKLPVRADFYHIDGDHTTMGCYHDMHIIFDDMLSGSYILVDDYDFLAEVRQAVDMFIEDYGQGFTWDYIKSQRGEILIKKR